MNRVLILIVLCLIFVPNLSAKEQIKVIAKTDSETIHFAASELTRYLNQMGGDPELASKVEEIGAAGAIQLGLYADFTLDLDVVDPKQDDAFVIDIQKSSGMIAGSNPRSVLFAVYRFLEAQGCRWIRPGKSGEILPKLDRKTILHDLEMKRSDRAFYRFRGVNNCGVYSFQDIIDKIDWSAKMGMNMFFAEFFFPRHFYNRYYGRQYPSYLPDETKSDEEIRSWHQKSVAEIKKRGMLYHSIGHGWTGVLVGAPEEDCDHDGRPIPDSDKAKYLALRHGKRTMENGPTYTDLCYGNPEVIERLVHLVADYAQAHPEVDFLHFWQDDRINNSCECELCKGLQPNEVYIRLLNEVDAELSRRKLDTKIVFLAYMELLWAPKNERIKNPDRFIFMFAPISRDYTIPYFVGDVSQVKIPEYQPNEYKLPYDPKLAWALLIQWQKIFSGPAFVFDYHMIWHHYSDFGYFDFAKIMAEDIRLLPKLGMQGYVSCQMMNATFPHGFPMYLHAKMLWDPNENFAALVKEFFSASFGDDWKTTVDYFQSLSNVSVRKTKWETEEPLRDKYIETLEKVPAVVRKFDPEIDRHLSNHDSLNPHQLESWKLLKIYGELTILRSRALIAMLEKKDLNEETQRWQLYVNALARTEPETKGKLDLYWSISMLPALKMKPQRQEKSLP